MPTIAHKQRPNIANTTVGSTAGFAMMVGAVSVCKAAGWKYAGSSDGTTVNKTTDPAQDRWNTTPGTIGSLTTSGSGAVVAVPSRGRAVVTGLTGMTAAMKGQFLKITGSSISANNNCHQIETFISATSVSIDARNFAVGADAVGRSWEVRNPLTEAISTSRRWWCGVGPHTLKIPITAYPSTRMLPGERLIQATTGFEGELRDVVWNVGSNTGYLTVYGQVRGTSGGVYGLSTGLVLTGQTTNATVTQNGTAQEFRMEMVIFSNGGGDLVGSVHYGCFDISTDTRFSALVASAGCTATVPPGGGGTGNAYPTYAWCAWGGSSGASWSRALSAATADTDTGWAVCADAIEERGYSADGSYMAGTLHREGNTYGDCQGLQLCEGGDYGDCAPWVSWTPYTDDLGYTAGITNVGPVLAWTQIGNAYARNTHIYDISTSSNNAANHNFLRGWSRRGFGGSYDRFQMYDFTLPMLPAEMASNSVATGLPVFEQICITAVSGANNAALMRSNNHDEMVSSLLPVGCGSFRTGGAAPNGPFKQHKGTFRWVKGVDGGFLNSLHHDGTFLQLAARAANFCVGPFNGVAPTLTGIVSGRLYLAGGTSSTAVNNTPYCSVGTRRQPDGTLIPSQAGIPADPGGANWESTVPENSRWAAMTHFRTSESGALTPFTVTGAISRMMRGYVSPPLAAQTISGTVKGQIYASVTVVGGCYIQSRLYVVTPTGAIRGVLRELLLQADVSGGLAMTISSTNRKLFRNGALTSLAVLAGDYLVLEIGGRNDGTVNQFRYTIGNASTTDLPEDEATTTTNFCCWIQFSTPLVFLDAGGSQS